MAEAADPHLIRGYLFARVPFILTVVYIGDIYYTLYVKYALYMTAFIMAIEGLHNFWNHRRILLQ